MRILNHLPAKMPALYRADPTTDDFDPVSDLKGILERTFFEKQSSLAGNLTPIVEESDGRLVSPDDAAAFVAAACADNVDTDAEAASRDLFAAGLAGYLTDKPYPAHRVYVNQAACEQRMELPDPWTIYTAAADVIPAAEAAVSRPDAAHVDALMCSIAFTYEPDTLGVAFIDDDAFIAFTTWFAANLNIISPNAGADTRSLARQLAKMSIDERAVEGIALRKDPLDSCEPDSFARVLHAAIMRYLIEAAPKGAWLMPFTLKQLFAPEHVVFVNVERHATATADELNSAWGSIVRSIECPVRVVSRKQLAQLDAVERRREKLAFDAHAVSSKPTTARASNRVLSRVRPSAADITRRIVKISAKMREVAKSENAVKRQRRTFARPSRRDPDNYNLPGKVTTTRFAPDIHLYVDTSGSISETDYASAVKSCIAIARKMGVNLYFTSFSDAISPTVLVAARGRSAAQMWRQIQRAPKVTGGTEYSQVWRYINASKKRSRELSVIITDFYYTAPTTRIKHPKNLWYAPCTSIKWDYIRDAAKMFVKSMAHIDPSCIDHILF